MGAADKASDCEKNSQFIEELILIYERSNMCYEDGNIVDSVFFSWGLSRTCRRWWRCPAWCLVSRTWPGKPRTGWEVSRPLSTPSHLSQCPSAPGTPTPTASPSWRAWTRSTCRRPLSCGALHRWRGQPSCLSGAWWSPTLTRPRWASLTILRSTSTWTGSCFPRGLNRGRGFVWKVVRKAGRPGRCDLAGNQGCLLILDQCSDGWQFSEPMETMKSEKTILTGIHEFGFTGFAENERANTATTVGRWKQLTFIFGKYSHWNDFCSQWLWQRRRLTYCQNDFCRLHPLPLWMEIATASHDFSQKLTRDAFKGLLACCQIVT